MGCAHPRSTLAWPSLAPGGVVDEDGDVELQVSQEYEA
jgi:hypothetical protein